MKSLFDENISRLNILSYKNDLIKKEIKIMIHRNHSFEMISNIINPFLNYFKMNAIFEYSSYDDSLTFSSDIKADLHILWLDFNRYKKETLADFLNEKIKELSSLTNTPIILAYIGELENFNNKLVYVVEVEKIIQNLNDLAYDLEKEKYSGTRLSAKSSILIAQYLGLKIIPSFFNSQIKAIVTDLDNTFYKGVVGEDGFENLMPYKNYQSKLKELSNMGYMLCIASKNDEDQVKDLFSKRNDFNLKFDKFTCSKINWDSKAHNIIAMAKEMNIGLDSILFIDDNIAEIETVKTAIPEIKTILFESEELTLHTLNLYPGFLKTNITQEDILRSKDIKANQERNELNKTLSKEEYFKKLGIKIELFLNEQKHIERIAELLNKTNQFILSYKRYSLAEVEKLLNSNNSCIVTASMSDKLSDSGIIAILICKKEGNDLLVDELTFSCRALGRNIEDIVISKMLQISKNYLKTTDNVLINYKKGPRNTPALTWLENFTGKTLKQEGCVKYQINNNIQTFGLEVKELCKMN